MARAAAWHDMHHLRPARSPLRRRVRHRSTRRAGRDRPRDGTGPIAAAGRQRGTDGEGFQHARRADGIEHRRGRRSAGWRPSADRRLAKLTGRHRCTGRPARSAERQSDKQRDRAAQGEAPGVAPWRIVTVRSRSGEGTREFGCRLRRARTEAQQQQRVSNCSTLPAPGRRG